MAAEGVRGARLHTGVWNQAAALRSNLRRSAFSGVSALSAPRLRRGLLVLLAALGCRPPTTISRQIQSGPRSFGWQAADCGALDKVIAITYLSAAGLLIEQRGRAAL